MFEEWVEKVAVLGVRIARWPPRWLLTQSLAGALHTEALECTLSVNQEAKPEIPAHTIGIKICTWRQICAITNIQG